MKQSKILTILGSVLTLSLVVSLSFTSFTKEDKNETALEKCENAIKGPLYTECFVKYYQIQAKRDGFKKTLNEFTAYTRETNDIQGACHQISHKIGETLWEEYLANITKVDPTVCSYGVIHGAFIQAAKFLSPEEFTDTLVGACDISPDPPICVHGFGHAIAEAKVTYEQANASCTAINEHYKDRDFYIWIPATCSEGYQMGLADHAEYLEGKTLSMMNQFCKAFKDEMFNGCIKAAIMTYTRYQPNDEARDLKLKEMIAFCKNDTFENCNRGIGRGLNEAFPPYLVSIKEQAAMMEKYCSQTNQVGQCVDGLLGQRIFATNYGYKDALLICDFAGKLSSICKEEIAKIPSESPNAKSANTVIK